MPARLTAQHRVCSDNEHRVCPLCGGSGEVIDDKKVGAMMRKERMKAQLSGREVAKRLGVSAAYLCDLELGRRGWNANRRHRYMRALQP